MATATKKKPAARRTRPKKTEEPMDKVSRSLEAAEAAVKDMRAGADKSTRDLIRDLETTLKHARTNARRVARAVKKDLKSA